MFCPSCGTANRDEAEMCSECGNVIPRLNDN
ncbi:MAG: zinc-ribbon domain-containing protein, partial [Asgard group archaeon]|nr:zinc-ribbon domain-containing protein [Asgard group archaeon]